MKVLVIGYGSELFGDDAVGPRAAHMVAEWQLPGVQAVAIPRLAPELVVAVADADMVLFVGADLEAVEGAKAVPVGPGPASAFLTDPMTPASLLALAQGLYRRHPKAWLVPVSVSNLDLGEGLSPRAEQGLAAALKQITELLSQQRP